MKNHLLSFSIVSLAILLISAGLPSRLEKAYEALTIYDYFKAKDLFYKSLKNDSVAASYGLSIIYSRSDNPFTQIDSAHKYINISQEKWTVVDVDSRLDCSSVGVDSLSISDQAYAVDSLAFLRAELINEIDAWDEFIDGFDNAAFRTKAVENRNEMVFGLAKAENTSMAFSTFLTSYPNAAQAGEAAKFYESRNFEERTAGNTQQGYQTFLDSFPTSPYAPDADERIYNMATTGGKAEDYLSFIQTVPRVPFRDLAGRRIYASEVKEVNAESIADFTLSYPDYPFMRELKQESELAVTRFYPITD